MRKVSGMVGLCVALSLAASAALVAQKADKKEEKRSKAEQVDIDTLTSLVDDVSAARAAAPSEVPVTWEGNHFFRAPDGGTYVPFTVTLDRGKLTAPTAAFYIRVVEHAAAPVAPAKGAKDKNAPAHPFEKIEFADVAADGRVSRYLLIKPGSYDVYVAAKDKGTVEKRDKNYAPKVGLLKKELTVPDFNKAELVTSSMLLASTIQQAPAGASIDTDPYVFGPMQFVPSRDGKYKKGDTLNVVYWIYGGTGDAAGKPDLQVENSFNQKTADGEKFFNKTQPQALNAQSPYSVSGGIPNFLEVPLLSFPAGDYRLEIKITDKPSGKSVTQNIMFTVAAS